MTKEIYYKTDFSLECPVNDYNAAREYLLEDDMTKYLVDSLRDDNVKEEEIMKIKNIQWKLQDTQSGYILLTTTDVLPNNVLSMISEWVSGQNSDGLGEGFEQQDFAEYNPEDYYSYDDEYCMASFDWKTNKYLFRRVSSPYSLRESYDLNRIHYRTNFKLTRSVTDFEEARKYLVEDDMRKYLLDDLNANVNITKEEAAKVIDIVWILETPRKGYVELTTNDYLSEATLDYISNWVSGQNSDGLGEGFEQQWFARTPRGRTYASFDWQTNDYKFQLDKNNPVRESYHVKRMNEI